ncbi:MAG: hypothetical protein WC284_17430, partial [Candidimonas sp.]
MINKFLIVSMSGCGEDYLCEIIYRSVIKDNPFIVNHQKMTENSLTVSDSFVGYITEKDLNHLMLSKLSDIYVIVIEDRNPIERYIESLITSSAEKESIVIKPKDVENLNMEFLTFRGFVRNFLFKSTFINYYEFRDNTLEALSVLPFQVDADFIKSNPPIVDNYKEYLKDPSYVEMLSTVYGYHF